MRKWFMGFVGLALAAANPIFADGVSEAAMDAAALKAIRATAPTQSALLRAIPTPGGVTAPAAGVPPMIANLMDVGQDETSAGLPCFFCAPAPGGGFGVSLTIPVGYIPTNLTTLDYSYMFQDVSVTDTCNLSFSLMQGTTIIDTATFAAGLYPSTWVVTFPRARPAYSGPATAVGFVTCGSAVLVRVGTKVVFQ